MVVRVYVNRHIIAANAKNGSNDPPISILKGGRVQHAHEVDLIGPARMIYRPSNPLKGGPRLWIECADAVPCGVAS